jgi:hypothetical protein
MVTDFLCWALGVAVAKRWRELTQREAEGALIRQWLDN